MCTVLFTRLQNQSWYAPGDLGDPDSSLTPNARSISKIFIQVHVRQLRKLDSEKLSSVTKKCRTSTVKMSDLATSAVDAELELCRARCAPWGERRTL